MASFQFFFFILVVIISQISACKPDVKFECTQPRLTANFNERIIEDCDILYQKKDFQIIPSAILFPEADETKTYTVVIVDPDAPGHEHGAHGLGWLHHIMADIPGSVFIDDGNIDGKTSVVDYYPPTPPQNTGIHRYFIYIFEQTDKKVEKLQEKANFQRRLFNTQEFASRNGLCGPIAMNMFKTQYE